MHRAPLDSFFLSYVNYGPNMNKTCFKSYKVFPLFKNTNDQHNVRRTVILAKAHHTKQKPIIGRTELYIFYHGSDNINQASNNHTDKIKNNIIFSGLYAKKSEVRLFLLNLIMSM